MDDKNIDLAFDMLNKTSQVQKENLYNILTGDKYKIDGLID